jgi:hypothetical protein
MLVFRRTAPGSLAAVLENLIRSHPASFLSAPRARAADRATEDRLAAMPAHLREDLGLPPVPPEVPEHPALQRARRKASRWG